jgi:hypothetical protein
VQLRADRRVGHPAKAMPVGKRMHGRTRGWSLRPILPRLDGAYDFSQFSNTRDPLPRNPAMQAMIAASFATRIQECPAWVKSAARATFVLVVIKGSVALATAWLAFRGFESL